MSDIKADSSAVQSYLSILQGIISRMASNSASSKTWCITIVSAILVLLSNNSKPELLHIALIPVILFLFLDAYYLGLERSFRNRYNGFVSKLHNETATIEDIYLVAPPEENSGVISGTFKSIFSLSVWPFYGILVVLPFIIEAGIFK